MRGRHRFLTGSVLNARVAQWGQRSFIKSIQQGSISLSGTSATATINAVDVNNSLLIYDGASTIGVTSNPSDRYGYLLTFTDSTTITASTNTAPAGAATVIYFTVIEFYPGVLRSVQRGTVSFGSGTTQTATVSAVNVNKALVTWLGHKDLYTGTDAPGTERPDAVIGSRLNSHVMEPLAVNQS